MITAESDEDRQAELKQMLIDARKATFDVSGASGREA